MDFRSAIMSPSGGATLQPPLFSSPAAPLSATAPGAVPSSLFLYPGLASPVKPHSLHLLASSKSDQRCTAAVPPLTMQPPMSGSLQPPHSGSLQPPQTGLPITSSPESASSFAAALKSLARNASSHDCGDGVKMGDHLSASNRLSASPKRGQAARSIASERRLSSPMTSSLPLTSGTTVSSGGGGGGGGGGGPPVVAIAPNTIRSMSPLTSTVGGEFGKRPPDVAMTTDSSSLFNGHDLAKSGFQPYRPDSSLYAGLYPLHPSHSALYSSRLEEQLYLERLALLRSPSALTLGAAPFSAFSGGQFPAASDLLHSSALYLHSQSLFLQQRLKLEEEARRRSSTTPFDAEKPRPPATPIETDKPRLPATPIETDKPRPLVTDTEPTTAAARGRQTTGPPLTVVTSDVSMDTVSHSSANTPRPNSVYRPYLLSPARDPAARAPLDLSPAGARQSATPVLSVAPTLCLPCPGPVSVSSLQQQQQQESSPLNLSNGNSSSCSDNNNNNSSSSRNSCQPSAEAVDLRSCRRAAAAHGVRAAARVSPSAQQCVQLGAAGSRAGAIDKPAVMAKSKHKPGSTKCDRVARQHRSLVATAVADQLPAPAAAAAAAAAAASASQSLTHQLTVALNSSADLPAKRLFLSSLGLVPEPATTGIARSSSSTSSSACSTTALSGRRATPYTRRVASPQSATAAAAGDDRAADTPAVCLKGPAAWKGVSQAIRTYCQYNIERENVVEQARAKSCSLEEQHDELLGSSQQLQLQLNAAVATRQQLHVQRDQLQQRLTQLSQLMGQLRQLPRF